MPNFFNISEDDFQFEKLTNTKMSNQKSNCRPDCMPHTPCIPDDYKCVPDGGDNRKINAVNLCTPDGDMCIPDNYKCIPDGGDGYNNRQFFEKEDSNSVNEEREDKNTIASCTPSMCVPDMEECNPDVRCVPVLSQSI